MKFPKISIVTPSFNQGEFLEETIQSVLDQNYPSLEYIVIDGGSTDQSKSILKKYDKRLTYWVSEKDSGQSEAINKGFKKATGEITSWLCSDDLYEKDTLKTVAELFNVYPDAALLHGKTILFDSVGKELIKGATPEDLALKYFAVIPYPQPSSFFRKSALDQVGYLDESLHFGMDYELLLRIALNYPIQSVEQILSRYRLHDQSKTVRQQGKFADEWLLIFCRFLMSNTNDYGISQQMKSAAIFKDDGLRYVINSTFTESELRLITGYFLYYQLVIYNDLLDKARSFQLIDLIREVNPEFYTQHQLKSIGLKLKILPTGVISFLRKLMRR